MKKKIAAAVLALAMVSGIYQTAPADIQYQITAEAGQKNTDKKASKKNITKARRWIKSRERAIINKEIKNAQKEYDKTEKSAKTVSEKYLKQEIKDLSSFLSHSKKKYGQTIGYRDYCKIMINGKKDHTFSPMITIDHTKRDRKVHNIIKTKLASIVKSCSKEATEEYLKKHPKEKKTGIKTKSSAASKVLKKYRDRSVKQMDRYLDSVESICGVGIKGLSTDKDILIITTENTEYRFKISPKLDASLVTDNAKPEKDNGR